MVGVQTHDLALSVADRTNDLINYDINSQNIVISLLIFVALSVVVVNCGSVNQLHTSALVIGIETMVGRAIQNEPLVLTVSDQAHAILEHAGWMQYLNRLQGFHEELTLEFL